MMPNTLRSTNYYRNKAIIDKRSNKAASRIIQVYLNELIDDIVLTDEPIIRKAPSLLFLDLWNLNKPKIYANYQRIINSKYTSNEAMRKLLIRNKADEQLGRVVEQQVERVTKNLNYVEQVLRKYEVQFRKYKRLVEKKNRTADRRNILLESVTKSNYVTGKLGLNINPHVYSYRNLDQFAENQYRETQMVSKHLLMEEINKEANEHGLDEPYTKKRWVWTGRGKTTRHESNNDQVVGLNEKFTITNDVTGTVDMMMHPHDPSASLENSYICYCEVEYY